MLSRLETHVSMLESAKKVLAARIENMAEEALLALLEETFPYVRHTIHSGFINPCDALPASQG